MKLLFTISLLFLSLFTEADYWTTKSFAGNARVGTISFSIGSKGYIGAGYKYDWQDEVYKDFWEYNPSSDTWTQKADYGGGQTEFGFSFSILDKGYAGAGLNNYFYEYNPSTNIWTQKASFHSRLDSGTGFSIGNLGYCCMGDDTAPGNQVWQYDPSLDVWTQKNNSPCSKRYGAIGFSIGTKGYIGGGYDGIYENDFWEYNPSTDSWTQKANISGLGRHYASGFSICNKGYATLGIRGSVLLNDLWEYDTTANQWTQKANFSGANREGASCFVIGDKAYVGTGGTSDFQGSSYFADFYEYTPDSNTCTTGINELSSFAFQFQVSPNPANQSLVISYQSLGGKEIEITIFDAMGRKVFNGGLLRSARNDNREIINVSDFAEGLYFIVADDGRERAVSKFVKE
jgi:N-acetylneuraminic acid mutarotase